MMAGEHGTSSIEYCRNAETIALRWRILTFDMTVHSFPQVARHQLGRATALVVVYGWARA
jgi:hypothetical protein